MSIVTVDEVRALVKSPMGDEALQAVIDREEAALIAHLGPHYDAGTPLVETHEGWNQSIFVNRPIQTIETITEMCRLGDTPTELTTDEFYVWKGEGRIQRLCRWWGAAVTVTYQPEDDTNQRKSTLIELVRLAVERTAMKSENVAGEYAYTAPDWDAVRQRLYRAHGFVVI